MDSAFSNKQRCDWVAVVENVNIKILTLLTLQLLYNIVTLFRNTTILLDLYSKQHLQFRGPVTSKEAVRDDEIT